MVRKIISLVSIVLSVGLCAQEKSFGNLWLQASDFGQSDRPISIFVKGDLTQIESSLYSINGTLKHSFRGYHSVVLPESKLKKFISQPFVTHFIFDGGTGQPLINVSKKNTKADQSVIYKGESWGTYKGRNVVMGIIDTGIDFGQPDFQTKGKKTRIVKIWDQTRNQDTTIRPSYGYGEVYDSSSINAGTCPHVDPNNYHGHGTMVSGIAAGNGNSVPDSIADYSGYASESPIVFVASDFGASNWTQTVADGVEWIFGEADKLGLPCVINISAGSYRGSHDGQDLVAQYIDSLVNAKNGRAIACAAGNAGSVAPFHLRTRVQNDTSFTWFKVNPSSSFGSAVFIEAWADTVDMHGLTFSFGATDTNSWKDTTYFVDSIYNRLDTLTTLNLGGGTQVMTWAERQGPNYLFQVLMLKPTPTSYYKLTAMGKGGYDCWNATWLGMSDMINSGLPGSGAYPSIGKYQKPDTLQNIVSSWNCHPDIISVGNYNNRLEFENVNGGMTKTTNLPVGGIGVTSSRGPNRRGVLKPDVAAPGNFTLTSGRIVDVTYLDTTPSQRHRLAKGGFHFINGGTSMASPVVAGLAAFYFEKCPSASYADFRNALKSTAFADSLTGSLPNFSFGKGKVDAKAMLEFSHIYDTIISSTGKFSFCEGDSLSLSLKSGSNYNYQNWSNGDSGQSVVVNDSNFSTPWKVHFENISGCKGYTDTAMTIQDLLPNVLLEGDTVFCLEDGDTLKGVSLDSNLNWTWNTGDTTESLVITAGGEYWVKATSSAGCTNTDSLTTKGILCYVSTEENLDQNGLMVYPNPVSTQLFVKSQANDNQSFDFEIIDQLGSSRQKGQLLSNEAIQLEDIPQGVYFLRVKEGDEWKTFRFVKQ